MTARTTFTSEEARRVGEEIGIDWTSAPFDVEQFRMGMDVELEHGLRDLLTNVSHDDPIVTGKIALAHLNEFPDYYTRLDRMEEEAMKGDLEAGGRRLGLILDVGGYHKNVITLAPSLEITFEEIDLALELLDGLLRRCVPA